MLNDILIQKQILEVKSENNLNNSAGSYYILNPEFKLRGWIDQLFGLVDTHDGSTKRLSVIDGFALLLCNGRVDLNLPEIPAEVKQAALSFLNNGIVDLSKTNACLNPEQEYKQYSARLLTGAKWAITGKCNLRCKHCFVSAPDAKFGELSHEECLKIVDNLAEAGIQRLILTGGEPLLRSDFFELIDYIINKGIVISTIATNGLLVNDRLLDYFESKNMKPKFNMSFDGPGWHDWLRGIDGAESILMKKFELLRDRGFRTGSAMAIHKNNLSTLKQTMDRLVEVGCQEMICNRVTGFGEWDKMGQSLSVSPTELFDSYLDLIDHYYRSGRKIDIVMNRFFKAKKDTFQYSIMPYKNCKKGMNSYVCNDIHSSVFISADAQAMPCLAVSSVDEIHSEFPSVLDEGLIGCINSPIYKKYTDYLVSDFVNNNAECRKCPHVMHCLGGCRAQALDFDRTDYLSRDIPNCVFFMNHYTEKILDVVRNVCPEASCVNLPDDMK